MRLGAAKSLAHTRAKIKAEWLLGILKRLAIGAEKPAFARLTLPYFFALAFAP